MCGILGYANSNVPRTVEQILDILLRCIQRVEYRGYDSAGLAIDANIGSGTEDGTAASAPTPRPCVVRSVGNIDQLRKKVFSEAVAATLPPMDATTNHHVGIVHTRWATHGVVCERNCHPQQSNNGEFTIVHNGIVTNYSALKGLLTAEGYVFYSGTDTEVISVLSEYLYTRKGVHQFADLLLELSNMVEGSYALLIKSIYFPGQVAASRQGSPLMVGIRQTDNRGCVVELQSCDFTDPSGPLEVFFSSDSNAFAEYTRDVVYLEDNDIVHYCDGALRFYNVADRKKSIIKREVQHLGTKLEGLSKGNYAHFMLKEIYEQAESVISSMHGRIDFSSGTVQLGGFTQQNIRAILASRRILFIACGTSLHSCIAVRPLFEELVPLPISIENASDFIDRRPQIQRNDACFFISQSGETADTLMALKLCSEAGAMCVGVTNVVESSVSRLTHCGVHLKAGVEVGVASTKAYTSQVIVMTLVVLLLSSDSVRLQERRNEILRGLSEVPAKITEVLRVTHDPMKALAARLKESHSVIVLGRGYDLATAMEAALKVKELSYVHMEGIHSGELKHGPLALIDETVPVLAMCTKDKHFDLSKAAVQQVNARNGSVVVFTTEVDAELRAAASEIVLVPATVDCLQCVINVIPFQLLAYYMALLRGNNVDCPRNLAKSVTVQ
ncbi:putative glucosamine-fructose-6-phosphate aminotransferase [Leishmania mexicana MHOM/GT/2001/U1103]|uniref:glutamine--fructose-6-phosphate transaminase (isomerizing) n=1 Tax=Leishmania mexicana (strain MHOM/GT/2001/U1103) TaxID=929439 RepID=E9AKX3_LEIMU|nr:putative glucosamine-fructose-6-phosphate aminotransferase [Leishmania mexicana MHOM/GT/2001/U1103]CBZ23576.1 putative glucosamine-fructose-6-phosphate aminotransferase [Leishmania mexicana MHOM/GT/2001/U1103]